MSEAPKRMCIHEGFWTSGDAGYWTDEEKTFDGGITYIRADLVDELVAALKICMAGNGYDFDETPAEVALKKLEDV